MMSNKGQFQVLESYYDSDDPNRHQIRTKRKRRKSGQPQPLKVVEWERCEISEMKLDNSNMNEMLTATQNTRKNKLIFAKLTINNNQKFCIIKRSTGNTNDNFLTRERNILNNLNKEQNENIIKLMGMSSSDVNRVTEIALEFGGVDCATFVFMNGGPMQESQAKSVIMGVLYALKTIHKLGYIHNDIKPQNVLYNAVGRGRYWQAKIIDFDAAIIIDEGQQKRKRAAIGSSTQTNSQMLTQKYAAPERLVSDFASFRCDSWSLYCLFFFLLTGKHPSWMFEHELTQLNDLYNGNRILMQGMLLLECPKVFLDFGCISVIGMDFVQKCSIRDVSVMYKESYKKEEDDEKKIDLKKVNAMDEKDKTLRFTAKQLLQQTLYCNQISAFFDPTNFMTKPNMSYLKYCILFKKIVDFIHEEAIPAARQVKFNVLSHENRSTRGNKFLQKRFFGNVIEVLTTYGHNIANSKICQLPMDIKEFKWHCFIPLVIENKICEQHGNNKIFKLCNIYQICYKVHEKTCVKGKFLFGCEYACGYNHFKSGCPLANESESLLITDRARKLGVHDYVVANIADQNKVNTYLLEIIGQNKWKNIENEMKINSSKASECVLYDICLNENGKCKETDGDHEMEKKYQIIEKTRSCLNCNSNIVRYTQCGCRMYTCKKCKRYICLLCYHKKMYKGYA